MRDVFVGLMDQMRKESPPSEWCECLLRSWYDPDRDLRLSREEESHIPPPKSRKQYERFAPTSEEIVHRAGEMHDALVREADWDPSGLLALPADVVEGLTVAFNFRGCKGLGMAEAMCLPFLLYSTDTVHILRLSSAMRGLNSAQGPRSARSARVVLGDYAGVICALVEAGGLLRRYVNPSRLLSVLSLQSKEFLEERQLVFRGLWLPRKFDVAELCRCYNLTSWSLWVRGALSVLEVYRGRVGSKAYVPVFLIALRSNVMRLALPTTALYFAASPDGKEVGRQDRPYECLPKSRSRPVRNDSGVAQSEKEIVLPPFSSLVPFEGVGAVKLSSLRSSRFLRRAASQWQLRSGEVDEIERELDKAWHEIVKGEKSLRSRDVPDTLVVFIREVNGSWF